MIRIPSASSPVVSRTALPQSAAFSKSVGTIRVVNARLPSSETAVGASAAAASSDGAPAAASGNGVTGGRTSGSSSSGSASTASASSAIFCLSASVSPPSRW